MFGWGYFSPVTSRVSARQPSYFFSAKPKKSNQKKGEPRPCRFAVPCATRSVRDTCKLASLEMSTPLNRLRRFPLQGTTPAARQSRFRGVPGRGCAALASPRLLVRFAHLAGLGCLISHASLLSRARHAVPLQPSKTAAEPQTSSFRAQSRNPCLPALQLGCCDYAQHDGMCRAPLPPSPTPFPVFPHSYDLTPHPSPLTPHPSLLTPPSSLLTPHSSLLTPHSYDLTPHFSQGHGTPCHYSLQRQRQYPKLRHSARSRGIHVCLHSNLDAATTRSMTACAGHRCPHHPHHSPSFLTPTTSPLTPHPSLLTPHSSPLTPHPSLLTPHPSLLTPTTSLLTPHSSPLSRTRSSPSI